MTDAGWLDEGKRLAERLIEVADPDDDLALGWAWYVLGGLAWQRCRSDEAGPAWRRALDHLRRSGDLRMTEECFGWYVSVPVLGPMRCDQALTQLRSLEAEAAGSVQSGSDLRTSIAWVLGYQGHVEEGRGIFLEYDKLLRELGRRETAAFSSQMIAWLELVAGNFEVAERLAEVAVAELDAMGSEVSGILLSIRAWALYELGRYDEAEVAAERGAEMFGDVSTRVMLRSVQAELLARRGSFDEAEKMSRDAVSEMDTGDFPNERGDARMMLAEVLQLAGRPDDAAAAIREAIALYEGKGNVLQAGTARAKLAELTG